MYKATKLAGQPVLCQLLSFLPRQIVIDCVKEHGSDRYYKTLTTYNQLVFMLYGVVYQVSFIKLLMQKPAVPRR
jgi:hypothetical protein